MANSENLLRRLRTTLDRPDTVLLIGSGTSLWSGLPTWEKLLIELAEFVERLGRDATAVRQEIKVGDLLLAASYAVHQLDLREFGAFIRQAANYPNAKPAEIHHLIATLGPSCFITTNYDRLLEAAFAELGPHCIPAVVTNRQVAEIADILPSYARRFVFKYHGDVEDAASLVLTRDQYRRIQHEYPATTRAFETLLATRPVVMIGFGLRDLDFLAVKDELVAAFEGHYIEVGQERVINEILEHATKLRSNGDFLDLSAESRLEHHLERLPYTSENIEKLRRLSKRRGSIGGVGAGGLFRVEAGRRNIILGEILRKPDDWNYIQTFVRVSKSCWSVDNFEFLIEELLKKRSKTDSLTIFGELVYELVPLTTILLWCTNYIQRASAAKYMLIEAIHSSDSRAARSILLDLVSVGEGEVIYLLSSNLEFHCTKLESDELLPDSHVAKSLISKLHSEHGKWAVSLARKLIEQRTDWKDLFRPKSKHDADTHLLLNIILSEETSIPDLVATALENIAEFDNYSLRILGGLEFWRSASSTLALAAICSRNPYLASAIMQQLQGRALPMLSARELDWWLDWEQECFESKVDPIFWCGYRISQFLNNGDEETRTAVLARFNTESETGFKQIGLLVFREGADKVTTDQFSKIAIDRLLNQGQEFQFSAAVLGQAATEEFVKSVMMPHLAANPRYSWVRKAIEIAGDRHNRRYLVGENESARSLAPRKTRSLAPRKN